MNAEDRRTGFLTDKEEMALEIGELRKQLITAHGTIVEKDLDIAESELVLEDFNKIQFKRNELESQLCAMRDALEPFTDTLHHMEYRNQGPNYYDYKKLIEGLKGTGQCKHEVEADARKKVTDSFDAGAKMVNELVTEIIEQRGLKSRLAAEIDANDKIHAELKEERALGIEQATEIEWLTHQRDLDLDQWRDKITAENAKVEKLRGAIDAVLRGANTSNFLVLGQALVDTEEK